MNNPAAISAMLRKLIGVREACVTVISASLNLALSLHRLQRQARRDNLQMFFTSHSGIDIRFSHPESQRKHSRCYCKRFGNLSVRKEDSRSTSSRQAAVTYGPSGNRRRHPHHQRLILTQCLRPISVISPSHSEKRYGIPDSRGSNCKLDVSCLFYPS